MKLQLHKGVTSKLLQFFVQDSTSTTGAGLTGLVFNTSSLSAYYYREGAASAVSITLATMTAGTWATGGFVVVDGTNLPGVYQLGVPDAAFAAGANSVIVMLKGAANMAPVIAEIQLTDTDVNDGTRFGMTALPNAAAGATGGLNILGHAGTAQAGASTSITLAAAASGTNNVYNGSIVSIVAGTGQGQSRVVIGYVASTKIASVSRAWQVTPDSTSVYVIEKVELSPSLNVSANTAQAGASTTITLAAAASAFDNFHNDQMISLTAGTGAAQSRVITAYNGTTKVATVDHAWVTTPDSTSVYVIYASDLAGTDGAGNLSGSVASVVGAVGSVTGAVGSVTGNVGGNVVGSVASVTGAVASVTGNVGGNVVGSVASVTGNVGGNVVGSVASVTGNVGGNVVGSVASVTGAVGSVTGNVGGNVNGNVVGSVGSVTAGVTVSTNNDKTGYSLTSLESFNLQSGTAQAGSTATTIKLASGADATNVDIYKGCVVKIYGGTGPGQARVITAYTASTRVATVDRAWVVTPDSTSTYAVLALDLAALDTSLQVAANGVNGNVTGSVGSVTGNVGGNVVGSVASVTAGVTVTTNNDKTGYSLVANAVDAAQFTQAAADKVWSSATRTLTAFAQGFADQVWSSASRTLTAFAQSFSDQVWTSASRTLTAFSTALGVAVWDVLETAIGTASSIGVKVKTALPTVAPGASGGLPTVDANNAVKLQSGTSANQISLASGQVTVATNNDKTGYSLAAPDSGTANSGTATSGSSTTITLPLGASGTDQLYRGMLLKITSGTGAGQARSITDYTSRVVTVDRAWTTNPDSTSVYAVVYQDIPKVDSSGQVVAASVQGNVTGSVASVTGAVGSVTGNVGGNVVGSTASVTNPVTVGTNNDKTGYALSGPGVQAIWDALTTALTTAGSIGKKLADWVLGTDNRVLVSANTHTSGQTVAAVAGAVGSVTAAVSLSAGDTPVVVTGTASAGAATTITLAGAAATDQLYRGETVKLTSGTGAGQTRAITDYIGATKVATVDRAWATNPDSTSVFAVLATNTPKLDSSLQTTAASVQGNVTGSVASVTGNVGGNVVGSVGSLAGQAQTDVKSQVVNALTVDTYAEVSSVPAATSTLKDKINWLFALARNKVTQTNTTQTLRNDSDTTSVATSTTSDDGTTYSRGKFS